MGIFCSHGHHNDGCKNTKAGQLTTIVSGGVNGVLAVIKICGGFITGSGGLIADGFHSLNDLASDVVAYITFTLARAEPDSEHPYGHHKFESLGLLILATLLGVVSLGILSHSLERWITGELPELGPLAAGIAVFSILANEGLFWYSYIVGKRVKSSVLIANAWHHRADAISSVIVLVGIGLNWLGYPFFDTLAALVVGGLLLRMAINMAKQACAELVDTAVTPEIHAEIHSLIMTTPGVESSHFLRAKQTAGQLILDVHVEVSPYISVSEGHAISDEIERRLHQKYDNISDAMVHIDPYSDEELCLIEQPNRPKLEALVRENLAKNMPDSKLEKLVLHALPAGLFAEAFITNATAENLEKPLLKMRKSLEKETGPFDRFTLYINAEKS
jgi:cation diffusion facilitator family transporter